MSMSYRKCRMRKKRRGCDRREKWKIRSEMKKEERKEERGRWRERDKEGGGKEGGGERDKEGGGIKSEFSPSQLSCCHRHNSVLSHITLSPSPSIPHAVDLSLFLSPFPLCHYFFLRL